MSEQEKTLDATLNKFFQGLQAGLKSLKEVRQIYDEQVAFEFNSVNFFGPNENKISEILAFFLDKSKPHGQKDKFLKIFLEKFNLEKALNLINEGKTAQVKLEKYINENRRIDIAIIIGKNDFVIGIENKIWNAGDQDKQIEDYSTFFENRAPDKYVLFYLTPDGRDPSEKSIPKEKLLKKKDAIQSISFKEDIIELFDQFELVCKADNVRAFIKDFQKYLKQHFLGEKIMGESEFIKDYIKNNPEIIKYQKALDEGIKELRKQCLNDFFEAIDNATNNLICKDGLHKRDRDKAFYYYINYKGTDTDSKLPYVLEVHSWGRLYIAIPFDNNFNKSIKNMHPSTISEIRKSKNITPDESVGGDFWPCGILTLEENFFSDDDLINWIRDAEFRKKRIKDISEEIELYIKKCEEIHGQQSKK
jgi:PD-(D/E)XK nuclease superfamily